MECYIVLIGTSPVFQMDVEKKTLIKEITSAACLIAHKLKASKKT
jgi:hypothetical protein